MLSNYQFATNYNPVGNVWKQVIVIHSVAQGTPFKHTVINQLPYNN